MRTRSTWNNGTENPNARLSWQDVFEMRVLYASGVSQKRLAELFHTTQFSVSEIVRNLRWRVPTTPLVPLAKPRRPGV